MKFDRNLIIGGRNNEIKPVSDISEEKKASKYHLSILVEKMIHCYILQIFFFLTRKM